MYAKVKRYLLLIFSLALVCPIFSAMPVFAQAPNNTSWQFQLERLRVAKAQEDGFLSDGDEPYFVVIRFASRFKTLGATQVNWGGMLDENWAGGIDTGNEKDIPAAMGRVTFDNIQIITRDDYQCRAVMPQGGGVLVVAMEHDRTPWDLVREVMNNLQNAINDELQKVVERGEIDLHNAEPDVRAAVDRIVARTSPGFWKSAEIIARSFGDPDDFIGYDVLLFGAADPRVKQDLAIPTVGHATLTTFEPLRFAIGANPLVFEGDGARYEVTAALTKLSGLPPQAIAGLTLTYNSPAAAQFPTAFTAQVAAGSGVTYDWTWGDGTKSRGCNVASHTFVRSGVYNVTVTASSYGQQSSSQSLAVNVTTVQLTTKIFLPVIQH